MTDEPPADSADHRARLPWLAALLSFVIPGLGHAYAGRYRLALIFALPMLVLAGAVAGVVMGAIDVRASALLTTGFLVAILALNGGVMIWRSAAIAHAGLTPRSEVVGPTRRTAVGVTTALVLATVVMHVWIGVVVMNLEQTLSRVFDGADPGTPAPAATANPSVEPGASPPAAPVVRWDGTDVINVLLLGTDATPGRDATLTDVILVVSIDPVAETAVMISVPRDTGFIPLPNRSVYADGIYPDKINSLYARAGQDPATWCPDLAENGEACGLRMIRSAVSLYVGIDIDHYALVDMAGFAQLIDALGGVELCLPGELVDPEFDGSLENQVVSEALVLPAGCHEYNGLDALAYARSRQGWIELPDGTREPQNDFARNERQQRLLLALRSEIAEADTLFELPGILSAVSRTVTSDFPRDQAGELATLLPLIAGPDIERRVLAYPDFVDLPADPNVNYVLVPNRDAIRDEMADLFGEDELSGWYLGSRDDGPGGEAEGEDPSS